MRIAIFLCTLAATTAWAGPAKKPSSVPPPPLAKAAKILDGAKRVDGTKTCTFHASAQGCILHVKTACKRDLGSTALEYWYTAEIPIGKLDPARTIAQANAGGHPGTHGVNFATTAEFPVITDSGDRSGHKSGVIGFAQGKGAAKRAERAVKLMLQAHKICK